MSHISKIEQGAVIGKGTILGENCYIGSNVIIGRENSIGSSVVIVGKTTIGDFNTIDTDTVLGSVAQDLGSTAEDGRLSIGDHNCIGSKVLINVGTRAGSGVTEIGNDNILKDSVHIGHDISVGNNCHLCDSSIFAGHVNIDDYAIISNNVSVHQFVTIGRGAKLESGSALTQDLPPYCRAKGNRARVVGLNEDSHLDLDEELKRTYHNIFEESGSIKEIAKSMIDSIDTEYARDMCRFILESKRGIPFKKEINVD